MIEMTYITSNQGTREASNIPYEMILLSRPLLQYMAGYLMSKLVKILQTKGGRMKVQGKMTPLFKPGRPMMTMTIPMTKLLWGPKCPER